MPKHPKAHCFHQAAPVFGLVLGDQQAAPAALELCCWCPGVRLTIIRAAPKDAAEHGPSLRFVDPPKIEPEPPKLVLPGQRRVLH